MCLATALQVIEIDGNTALCDSCGIQRRVRIDLIADLQVGDYVLSHAGFAIERLPQQQALEDLEAWEELENALR